MEENRKIYQYIFQVPFALPLKSQKAIRYIKLCLETSHTRDCHAKR